MYGAKPYKLSEAVADGFGSCGLCDVPVPEIIDMPVVWMDNNDIAHVSDECPELSGKYTLVSIYDLIAMDNVEGCAYCGCDEYIASEAARLEELAKNATVYYNDGSKYYHKASSCVNMRTADEHNLYDAMEKGLRYCNSCEPVTLYELDMQAAE